MSAFDELPLWSAPFGLRLLDAAMQEHATRILDVGCGCGDTSRPSGSPDSFRHASAKPIKPASPPTSQPMNVCSFTNASKKRTDRRDALLQGGDPFGSPPRRGRW